jgi:hypothetical protein
LLAADSIVLGLMHIDTDNLRTQVRSAVGACSHGTVVESELGVMRSLATVMNFPTSKRYTFSEGLLATYRERVHALRLQRLAFTQLRSGQAQAQEDAWVTAERDAFEQRNRDLEAVLAAKERDVGDLSADNANLLQLLELLKDKYSSVISAKHAQAEELLRAETTKTELQRSLLEYQLQWSKEKQAAEEQRYHLESQVLHLQTLTNEALHDKSTTGETIKQLEAKTLEQQRDVDELRSLRVAYDKEVEAHAETAAQLCNMHQELQAASGKERVEALNAQLAVIPRLPPAHAGTVPSTQTFPRPICRRTRASANASYSWSRPSQPRCACLRAARSPRLTPRAQGHETRPNSEGVRAPLSPSAKEKQMAELFSRNVMLEEELSSYKEYMKLTVARYNAVIKEMKRPP